MKRVHILHTNDLHSHLSQTPKLYSLISSIRTTAQANGESLLLVDIGDHLDRAMFETEGTNGRINQAILEEFAYDVITFGNNELLTFLPNEIGLLYQNASFTVVSSNVKELKTQKRPTWLRSSTVVECQGMRIGFLGVTIPFDIYYEQMGWLLSDPMLAVQQEAKKLRNQVDLLIVLSHVGILFDRELAQQVAEVDLILGGHTHHLLMEPEKIAQTWVAAAGLHGQHLGHIIIDWDEKAKRIRQLTGTCYPVDGAKPEPQITHLLQKYRAQAEQALATPVVNLSQPLSLSWQQESPLANLLADSLVDWTGVKIALVNSGQLLAELPSGIITKRMLHQICPHPINPVVVALDGAEIFAILEESLMSTFANKEIRGFGFRGKFLGNIAVAGLEVAYDISAPSGQKIQSIMHDGHEMEREVIYPIATIDMLTFGVGYARFKKGKVLKTLMPEFLRDLLYQQLQKPSALKNCRKQRFRQIS